MKVSVVVCTYASERYDHFVEAVESILAQTYDLIEIMLVVDGNEQVFDRVVAEFGDRDSVVTHCNDTNRGVSTSRTTGAELATGEVVAFIDDDAVADQTWIAELVAVYESTDAIAVGGWMAGQWLGGQPWFLPEEFYWLISEPTPDLSKPARRSAIRTNRTSHSVGRCSAKSVASIHNWDRLPTNTDIRKARRSGHALRPSTTAV